jgi:hypothetical protein
MRTVHVEAGEKSYPKRQFLSFRLGHRRASRAQNVNRVGRFNTLTPCNNYGASNIPTPPYHRHVHR